MWIEDGKISNEAKLKNKYNNIPLIKQLIVTFVKQFFFHDLKILLFLDINNNYVKNKTI